MCPPGSGGGEHSLAREELGESQFRRGDILCGNLYIYVLCGQTILTINVPVVYMERYVMVLRRATSLRGALEGVGPENQDFFGP